MAVVPERAGSQFDPFGQRAFERLVDRLNGRSDTGDNSVIDPLIEPRGAWQSTLCRGMVEWPDHPNGMPESPARRCR
jgi:hypothetical protein